MLPNKLHDEWISALHLVATHGAPVAPANPAGATRELLNRRFDLNDSSYCLLDVPSRNLNLRFAVAEFIWMATGRSDLESLTRYNSVMKNFSDDGLYLTGAYGPHLRGGLARVIRKLKEDPLTRQAVLQIPRPQIYYTKDEPCTLSMQFLQRNGVLHCIVTMRSSDLWLGIPYDVFSFAMFQNCLAGELGLERGGLSINAGSQHIYTRNLEDACSMSYRTSELNTLRMPALPGFPPQWVEDVLAQRSAMPIPITMLVAETAWLPLCDVLLCQNSTEAREFLAGSAYSSQDAR